MGINIDDLKGKGAILQLAGK